VAVKAIELVRRICDSQYEETKSLSMEQIKFIKRKAEALQKQLKKNPLAAAIETSQTTNI
jgi:hypothetical protein